YTSWPTGLSVVLENSTLSWQWDDPPEIIPTALQVGPSKAVHWKDHYFLTGTLRNQSQYSAEDCAIALIEVDTDTSGVVNYGPDNEPSRLKKHGGYFAVNWGGVSGFSQEWQWFVSFVNNISGPLQKSFLYNVKVDITDEFGNVY